MTLIPGKLYRIKFLGLPDHEPFTSMQPVHEQHSREWVKVTPETILMFISNEPDGRATGAVVAHFLVNDKIYLWCSHAMADDFERVL